jgi:hypothetical protein
MLLWRWRRIIDDSSASFLKVFECCRDLERVDVYGGGLVLESSDIKASPRLKSLYIKYDMTDEAVSALSRCR